MFLIKWVQCQSMSPTGVDSYFTEFTVCKVCRCILHLVGVVSGVGRSRYVLVQSSSRWRVMSPHSSIHSNQRKRKEEGHQKKGAVTKVCVCLKTSSAPPLSPPCREHLYGSHSILGLHSPPSALTKFCPYVIFHSLSQMVYVCLKTNQSRALPQTEFCHFVMSFFLPQMPMRKLHCYMH